MNRHAAFFAVLLIGNLGLAFPAQAGAIFVSGDRHITLFATDGNTSVASSTDGLFTDSRNRTRVISPTNSNSEAAAQDTTVGTLLFGGTGSASMDAAVNAPVLLGAESVFDVTFTLASVHDFLLDALLSGDLETGRFTVNFWLKSTTDSIAEMLTQGSISKSGTLQPGTYSLYALASVAPVRSGTQTNGVARAGFDFSLSLSPQVQQIPLPASVLLVALGLAAIRRRLH